MLPFMVLSMPQHLSSEMKYRPDFETTKRVLRDNRPIEEIEAQYRLEKGLASRLKNTPEHLRGDAYIDAYAELFRHFPQMPLSSPRSRRVGFLTKRLLRRLNSSKTFLEIGCGDALLTKAIAQHALCCYAVDVNDSHIDRQQLPANVSVIISRGGHMPIPDKTVDYAFSDQVMEHLLPGDASAQLREIFRVLKPGGSYHCITPNRVLGPHDISVFFDYEATGLHLCEYDSQMLTNLFKRVGFRKVRFFASAFGYEVGIPNALVRMLEMTLLALPRKLRSHCNHVRPIIMIAGLDAIAIK